MSDCLFDAEVRGRGERGECAEGMRSQSLDTPAFIPSSATRRARARTTRHPRKPSAQPCPRSPHVNVQSLAAHGGEPMQHTTHLPASSVRATSPSRASTLPDVGADVSAASPSATHARRMHCVRAEGPCVCWQIRRAPAVSDERNVSGSERTAFSLTMRTLGQPQLGSAPCPRSLRAEYPARAEVCSASIPCLCVVLRPPNFLWCLWGYGMSDQALR